LAIRCKKLANIEHTKHAKLKKHLKRKKVNIFVVLDVENFKINKDFENEHCQLV
jgi:hypothetical protein